MNSFRLNTVKVRMSDAAVLAGSVSLLYALALIVFPRAFPHLLERIFAWGPVFPALTGLLVVANETLFFFIAKRRGQKPGLLTPAYIVFLTIAVVAFFRLLLYAADANAQFSHLFLRASSGARDGISSEDRLVYTHLTIVSGIFLPYLLVRLTENYVSDANVAEQEAKARNAVAGQ
jgi:hypothetical protein